MTFSLNSLFFVIIVFLVFYLIRRRARAYSLLVFSLLFIAFTDMASCFFVVGVTAAVYLLGLFEDFFLTKNHDLAARTVAAFGTAACVAALFVLKAVSSWNFADEVLSGLILPLGFSYYIFQAISYLTHISKRNMKAEKNLLFFALYMCFFPKFLSGPIEEPERLLPQIKALNTVNLKGDNKLYIAIPTLLYGYFMKTVVADRLALYTPKLLDNPSSFGSGWLFLGMLMYTLQLFCDFAGYSAIAVGVAKLFGIELTENFHAPYLSTDIQTFWRRWHISLSWWLRDHLYIPLGGNRKGTSRRLVNTMIVFLACGLWHGLGSGFFVWGLLHGIFVIAGSTVFRNEKISSIKKEYPKAPAIVGGLLTFFSVSFAWVFFGAGSASKALGYIGRMLSFTAGESSFAASSKLLGVTKLDLVIPAYAIIVLLFDLLILKKDKPVGEALDSLPVGVKYAIEYILLFVILLLGVYGPGYNPSAFMYMGF